LPRAPRLRIDPRLLIVALYWALLATGLMLAAYRPPATVYESSPLPLEQPSITRPIGHGPDGVVVSIDRAGSSLLVGASPGGLIMASMKGPEAGTLCDGLLIASGLEDGYTLLLATWEGARLYRVETGVVLPGASAAACNGGRATIVYSPFLVGPTFILALDPWNPENATLLRLSEPGWRWASYAGDRLLLASPGRLAVVEEGRALIYRLPEGFTAQGVSSIGGEPVVPGSYNGTPAVVLPGGSMLLLEYPAGEGEGRVLAYTIDSPGWASLLVLAPDGRLQYVQVGPGGARGLDVIVGGAWVRLDAWASDGSLYLAGQRIRGENKTLFLAVSEGAIGVPTVVGWPDYIVLAKQTLIQPVARLESAGLELEGEVLLEPVQATVEYVEERSVEATGWARVEGPRVDPVILLFAVVSLTMPPAYAAWRALSSAPRVS